MGTSTSLLGLYKPASGETPWDVNMNANLDKLDTPAGLYGSRNNTSQNNATTPNTKFDLTADAVLLKGPLQQAVTRLSPGTITCDITVTGPAANGCDQATAISTLTSQWVHLYWIWNPTTGTLATIASLTAPPTGPSLPSGYTFWSYCGAVRLDGSSHFVKTRFKGSWAHYENAVVAVVGAGVATSENTLSLATQMPPNALAAQISVDGAATATGAGAINVTFSLRVITGNDYYVMQVNTTTSTTTGVNGSTIIPNVGQSVIYLVNSLTNVSAMTFNLRVAGYRMPNGGE
jgi:hypothetical protein